MAFKNLLTFNKLVDIIRNNEDSDIVECMLEKYFGLIQS